MLCEHVEAALVQFHFLASVAPDDVGQELDLRGQEVAVRSVDLTD